jgi:hypothetical protein
MSKLLNKHLVCLKFKRCPECNSNSSNILFLFLVSGLSVSFCYVNCTGSTVCKYGAGKTFK